MRLLAAHPTGSGKRRRGNEPEMDAFAVVFDRPESLALSRLPLTTPGDSDVVVDVAWSGISTGTERLLYLGRMPPFPGMGYPLVPGYETVGRIVDAGRGTGPRAGEMVFVPGANCFGDVRGLFGGAASRLVVPASRTLRIDPGLREQGVLLALAATAWHVLTPPGGPPLSEPPDLIVGHGVLGTSAGAARGSVRRAAAGGVGEQAGADGRGGRL